MSGGAGVRRSRDTASRFCHPLLNDSKKMSEKNRYLMRDVILRDAVAWAVAEVSPEEIDRINILNASFAGMSRAVERLSFRPGLLLIDGNRFRSTLGIPFECIVGGDGSMPPLQPHRYWPRLSATTE